MDIELTITPDYLPAWGTTEGIRELIQNAKDAETEFGARMEIFYSHKNETLSIKNTGASLTTQDLLLGKSSKRDRDDMIGKFGEGLKLGILALVRDKHPIVIYNANEKWIPSIKPSQKFNSDVLVFTIRKRRKQYPNNIEIIISDISEVNWFMTIRPLFLFLMDPSEITKVKTYHHGEILLNPNFAGKVYVKEQYINTQKNLVYGYNLINAEVDRDRKIIASWDLNYRLADLWINAVPKNKDLLLPKFTDLLLSESEDTKNVSNYHGSVLGNSILSEMNSNFKCIFGENSVPVCSVEETQEATALGMNGVVLPKQFVQLINYHTGGLDAIKSKLGDSIILTIPHNDLMTTEKANLDDALFVMNELNHYLSINIIEIVEFAQNNKLGMYSFKEGGRIFISRKQLRSLACTLRVLLHEYTHYFLKTKDTEIEHTQYIEVLWEEIFGYIISKRPKRILGE